MKTGVEIINQERQRQIEEEGWTPEHDDQHTSEELPKAAACYAIAEWDRVGAIDFWPFEYEWWKPTPENRVKELAKAGAFIAAEIDRINRKTKTTENE